MTPAALQVGRGLPTATIRPAHVPSVFELCDLTPEIGRGIAESLDLLAVDPSVARATQAAAQLNGALAFVRKLRAQLAAGDSE